MMSFSTTLMNLLKMERRRTAAERTFSAIGLFLGGAALGAGTALLFAPSKGTELRRRLVDRTESLARRATEGRQSSGPSHGGGRLEADPTGESASSMSRA